MKNRQGAYKETGATFAEYVLLASILGAVTLYMVSFFEPSSTNFRQNETANMFIPYPVNYIPPP